MGNWYRVIDPLNPLYGCDVRCRESLQAEGWMVVEALRRVDVFVGDRPFQLVAPKGGCLGLLVDSDNLEVSPIQDEVMETATDRPYGLCLNESEMQRGDEVTLRIARYEYSTQIALLSAEGKLLATQTLWNGGPTGPETTRLWEEKIVSMFERGDDQDDIAYALRNT